MRSMSGKVACLLCLVIVVISCSTPSLPPPVPVDDRITCAFEPLRDLTGQYDVLDRGFDDAVYEAMQRDYLWSYVEVNYPGRWRTEFITNTFTPSPLGSRPNQDKVALLIRGSVEQIKYGSPREIKEYIVDYWLFGILGALRRDAKSKGERAALVEYRLELYDVAGNEILDTWVIQGAYKSGVADRSRIVQKANEVAAQRLLFRLNDEIATALGRPPTRKQLSGRWKGPPR